MASRAGATFRVLVSFCLQIGDMNRSPIEDGACDKKTALESKHRARRYRPIVSDDLEEATFHPMDGSIIGVAEAGPRSLLSFQMRRVDQSASLRLLPGFPRWLPAGPVLRRARASVLPWVARHCGPKLRTA